MLAGFHLARAFRYTAASMHNRTRALALFLSLILAPLAAAARAVPAPEDVLGFRPGDDRKLASWASVIEYFRRLDEASDRVRFEELGRTTMGAPFVMALISAPENLR